VKLTAKQERFVAEYLVDGNGTQAALRSGYSARTARVIAYENLLKPAVRTALQARQGVIARQVDLTRQDVLAGLLEAVALARQQANPAGMIAGLREIAKMCGYYAPETKKVGLTVEQDSLRAKYEVMSDEELLAIIAGG
jgi:phage terminase small subunit